MRLSPGSAGDKNAITNIIASQQVRRAPAVDRFMPGSNVAVSSLAVSDFMVLLLLLRASVADFPFRASVTVRTIRRHGDNAQELRKSTSRISAR
jgi:hypothetical protein